jgi:transcriptional regulator with XRE-family HTH domain
MTDGERDPGTFGAMLKAKLDERRWPARELARRGLNQQTVRNMLAGRRPQVENVIKLAKALDEPVNPWLKAAGYPEQSSQVEEEELLSRIANGAALLDPVERRVLARMVEGILVARGYIDAPTDAGAAVEAHTHAEDEITGRVRSGPVEFGNEPITDPESDRTSR